MKSIFGDDLDEEEDGESLLPPQPQMTVVQDDSAAANTSDVANDKKRCSLSASSCVMSSISPALARYAQCDPLEYEDVFCTFPLEAIRLDPNSCSCHGSIRAQ
jgi:hypothetical protein